MKVVEERDHEIVALQNQMQTREIVELSQTPTVKPNDKGKNMLQYSTSITSLSVQQL